MARRNRTLVRAMIAAAAAATALVTLAPQAGAAPATSLRGLPAATASDGASIGDWYVVFAGYGSVVSRPVGQAKLVLQPRSASSPDETHAALVVSNSSFVSSKLDVTGRLRTDSQLRTGSASNPWETGWLIWDYTDNDHFSYAIAKTNGWELGKRDPAYPGGQRFLATGDNVSTSVGSWTTTHVRRVVRADGSTRITLTIGNRKVASTVDRERAYRSGKVGVYTEDAKVSVAKLAARSG
ncbi:MAG: calcium-binding protein [Candidatus Nanopelagicales bacterium]